MFAAYGVADSNQQIKWRLAQTGFKSTMCVQLDPPVDFESG